MVRQLLFVNNVNESLEEGIVCYKVIEGEEISHFFFTKNKDLISYVTNGFSPDLLREEAFDILNNKVLELKTDLFTGGVYSVASCYSPEEELELKDVNLYLGNKSGAVVVSDKVLGTECTLEDLEINGDDKHFIFKACLGIKEDSLEDIYLVQ